MVNVADDRNDHRAPRGDRHEFRSNPPRGDRNEFQSTRCREQAPRATRRIGTMVNVADDCNDHRAPRGDRHEFRSTLRAATDMNFGLRFAENGAPRATRRIGTMLNVADNRNEHRAPRGDRHEFRSNPPRGDRNEFRSTLCWQRASHTTRQFSVLSSQLSVPGSRFLVPGSRFSVLSSQLSVPGSRFLVLGSWFLVLSSQFLVLNHTHDYARCAIHHTDVTS